MKASKQAKQRAVEVMVLTELMSAHLAGRPREVQSAVIADLLAMLLAGHVGPRKKQVREELLQLVLKLVRDLVPVNEARAMERMKARGRA